MLGLFLVSHGGELNLNNWFEWMAIDIQENIRVSHRHNGDWRS